MPPDSDRKPCAHMTLQELDEARRDVRAWCFACARGEVVDTIVWQRFAERGWPMLIGEAARRFTCRGCGSAADVGLFPIGRAPPLANEPSRLVEAFFHGMRSRRKRSRNDTAKPRLSDTYRKRDERPMTIRDPFTIVEVAGSYAVAWREVWRRELDDTWAALKGARWIADGPFRSLAEAEAGRERLLARLAEGPKSVE